jgi:DNA-binding transcriptional LysR family regulator
MPIEGINPRQQKNDCGWPKKKLPEGMRLRQLECFRALMLHGTMTRAAEMLRMSQPAVSTTIAALEHSIGLTLFVRRGSRLHPTPEAQLFYVEASKALDAIEGTAQAAREIRSGRRGSLSIVAYPNVSISLLPRLMSSFAADRPDLQLKIITRPSQAVKELISTNTFDIAISELPTNYPISHMEVVSFDCVCMLPKGHPLCRFDTLTPRELDGIPFVTLFKGDPLYLSIAAAFSKMNAAWNVVVETEFLTSACEFVASGHGVGLIDPVISAAFTDKVELRPFEPTITYQIAILYPIHDQLSRVALDFVEILRKAFNDGRVD